MRKVWIANGIFYSQLVVTITVYEVKGDHTLPAIISFAMPTILACLLLLYTIHLFNSFAVIGSSGFQKEFFANEKLMKVHTFVFSFQTLILVIRTIVNYLQAEYAGSENWQKYCYATIVYIPIKALSQLSTIVTVCLFIYMTSEMSQPLTAYWQDFLLVYQSGLEGAARVSEHM